MSTFQILIYYFMCPVNDTKLQTDVEATSSAGDGVHLHCYYSQVHSDSES